MAGEMNLIEMCQDGVVFHYRNHLPKEDEGAKSSKLGLGPHFVPVRGEL